MKFLITPLFALLTIFTLSSQNTISGRVLDSQKAPIVGANIYLEGSYDGANSDIDGTFSFTTELNDTQTLIVSSLSFETQNLTIPVTDMINIEIVLRENIDALDAVIINAGSFEAGSSKVSVLKPMDVVTTASALADVFGALQTLPGTSNVAEDGRLFVRGGTSEETQIFIDGIRVFTPYTPTTNNTPTRGRYSPFLFDGISFSTGGYSAEYGEALSSVLVMNTIDEPDQEKTDISIMSVGLGVGHTEKWNKNSLSINTSYINLAPYIELAPDRNDWEKPYQSGSGELIYRHQLKNGLFRFYTAFDKATFSLTQEDINFPEGRFVKLDNSNLYLNSNYQGTLGRDWSVFGGISFTDALSKIDLDQENIRDDENSLHLKFKFKKRFNSRIKWFLGAEHFYTGYNQNYKQNDETFGSGYDQNISAGFSELEYKFNKNLAVNTGLRLTKYHLSQTFKIDPRLALAYKISDENQVSLAYGLFSQSQQRDYLKFNSDLESQKASHYILNYQYSHEGQIFRAEIYRKHYRDLINFQTGFVSPSTNLNTSGNGYANGVDVFWRDNKSLKNIDYWLSYSYLDTKRNFLDYGQKVMPPFANKHNLSAVGKLWVENWKSQLGISYSYSSGRPFTDPNNPGIFQKRTKAYNNVSLNWAYLLSPQKIIYASVNNAFAFKNINGYEYSNTPDANGFFERRALRQAADQFFFIGFFWTISENKTDNQLNNL